MSGTLTDNPEDIKTAFHQFYTKLYTQEKTDNARQLWASRTESDTRQQETENRQHQTTVGL